MFFFFSSSPALLDFQTSLPSSRHGHLCAKLHNQFAEAREEKACTMHDILEHKEKWVNLLYHGIYPKYSDRQTGEVNVYPFHSAPEGAVSSGFPFNLFNEGAVSSGFTIFSIQSLQWRRGPIRVYNIFHSISSMKERSHQGLQYFPFNLFNLHTSSHWKMVGMSCCKAVTSLKLRNPSSQKFQSLQHFGGSSEVPMTLPKHWHRHQ